MRARRTRWVGILWLTAVLLGVVLPPLVAAGEPTTITFWTFLDPRKTGPRERALAQIIQSFEQKQPDIKVRVELFPWKDIAPKLIVSAAAGRGPDVSMVNTRRSATGSMVCFSP